MQFFKTFLTELFFKVDNYNLILNFIWKRTVKMFLKKERIFTLFCLVAVMSDPWNLIHYNLPGSSIHGISQARILEWVAISSSMVSSWPRDWTHVSCVSCITIRFFTTEPLRKPPYINIYIYRNIYMQIHVCTAAYISISHTYMYLCMYVCICT